VTRVAVVLLAAGAAAGSLGADCGGGPTGPDAPVTAITEPQGFGQLVPGGTLVIGWTASGSFDPAHLDVDLAPRDIGGTGASIVRAGAVGAGTEAPSATGVTWAGLDADGNPVTPGFYDVVVGDDRTTATFEGGDSHIVVVQGLRFTAPAPGATLTESAAAPAQIQVDTATVGTLGIQLVLDPDTSIDGDEITIQQISVPGELRTVGRVYTWGGTDTGGAQVAAGDYTIAAIVTDAASDMMYRVDGGTVTVAP